MIPMTWSKEWDILIALAQRNDPTREIFWYNLIVKDGMLRRKCCICGKDIDAPRKESSSYTDKAHENVRKHGMQHLKERGLLPFM